MPSTMPHDEILVSPQLEFQDEKKELVFEPEVKDEEVAKVVMSLSAREILVGPVEGPNKDSADGHEDLPPDSKSLYKVFISLCLSNPLLS